MDHIRSRYFSFILNKKTNVESFLFYCLVTSVIRKGGAPLLICFLVTMAIEKFIINNNIFTEEV